MPASLPPNLDPGLAASRERVHAPGGLAHPLPPGLRDLLPVEARRERRLAGAVVGAFELFGYEPVALPPFEYASVVADELGPLDPGRVLRFVEPETGEVAAIRPDITPQIARLVATRLAAAPEPARLCYEGAVVRRRVERARREREIHQAGIELVGLAGPEGDLEVLEVAAAATCAAGLGDFVVDLGHAGIAGSLLGGVADASRRGVYEALSAKDAVEVRRRAVAAGLAGRSLEALVALPGLHGDGAVFTEARALLGGTPAAPALEELAALHAVVVERGFAPRLLVDLGETWSFAYYTGVVFQLLAEGPGEAVGSGGRYDRLLDRFGAPRPAAGFGLDLGNLAWALARAGAPDPVTPRVLVRGDAALAAALRARGVPVARASAAPAIDYARAWRYTHVLSADAGASELVDVASGQRHALPGETPADLSDRVVALLGPATRATSEGS